MRAAAQNTAGPELARSQMYGCSLMMQLDQGIVILSAIDKVCLGPPGQSTDSVVRVFHGSCSSRAVRSMLSAFATTDTHRCCCGMLVCAVQGRLLPSLNLGHVSSQSKLAEAAYACLGLQLPRRTRNNAGLRVKRSIRRLGTCMSRTGFLQSVWKIKAVLGGSVQQQVRRHTLVNQSAVANLMASVGLAPRAIGCRAQVCLLCSTGNCSLSR